MRGLTAHVLRDHVGLGGLVALVVAHWHGSRVALLFWAANILVDSDHYLHYLVCCGFRDWSPLGMFRFHQNLFTLTKRPDFLSLEIFHTAELFALALVISVRYPAIRPAIAGAGFHMVVDFFHLLRHGIVNKRANSIIEFWIRCRRLKAAGHDPSWVHRLPTQIG